MTEEIVRVKFDMRAILRELAQTRAYQLSFDLSLNVPELAEISANQAELLLARTIQTQGGCGPIEQSD